MEDRERYTWDHEAERACLGCCLIDATVIPQVRSIVRRVEEFTIVEHQLIWTTICELSDTNKPMDGIVIRDTLVSKGKFEDAGGYETLQALIGSVGSSFRAADYARIVHEHYIRRVAAHGGQVIVSKAKSLDSIESLVSTAAECYERLAELNVSATAGDGNVSGWLDDDLVAIMDGRTAVNAIPTGFYELDEKTGGLQCGALTVIAARPSHGKTSLAHNIADRVCVTDGVPLTFFTLEVTGKALLWQWASARAMVNGWLLKKGVEFPDGALELIKPAVKDLYGASGRLSIYGSRAGDLNSIVNLVRMDVRRRGMRVFMVDYLSLVDVYGRFERRDLAVGHVVKGLKRLALEHNIAAVLLVQLNREREKENRPPRLTDLRESGEIEQHADVVIFPHQRSEDKTDASKRMESGPCELIVAKNRTGPTGTCGAEYKAFCTRFVNPSGTGGATEIGQ